MDCGKPEEPRGEASRDEDVAYLVRYLLEERGIGDEPVGDGPFDEAFARFRALVNTREPRPADERFLTVQDRLLRGLVADKGIVDAAGLPPTSTDPRLSVWRGDIVALAADAVVNAANSALLGCWVPGHHCIDNAIHTFAGVQLRLECARLMERQGHEEPAGRAKVTGAYNLPAGCILHTVGPVANGSPGDRDRRELASCYESCLDAAAARGCRTVAFCCVSTGVFGFPQAEAASIAVATVRAWLDHHEVGRGSAGASSSPRGAGAPAGGAGVAADSPGGLKVVFNVFTDEDERIYHGLLDA
ncbi:protein-ADP-ribose hydrolase [Gordonibacter massiliensis (ex Traore et al. 2017)]|uniref:protein-ADP-ribose hydrolase n=1 Tax=Gordonibacter massiliensis (ex Traore et al. 2017) TaxID=1841863 RepID=UPI001C8C986D|nr:protein-ADP-ribose hydrolase [Gordonibacter massiliensis (ex Traore et al. 2017)]MBX9035328.1 protein-ADP-ribose hydrolase [Gordonibacter massiliensis (ex Traore et al. 2017)]